jgi:hypothetical protein
VDIEASFFNHYNSVCQSLGFPSTVTASGIVTGTVEGNCLDFENAGHLKTHDNKNVLLNGNVCITDVDDEGNTTDGVIGTVPME